MVIYVIIRKGNIMEKNLSADLKKYKEEFDFFNKKIGELEWEYATIFYGRKGIRTSEIELLEEQLENYRINKEILLDKVIDDIRISKESKFNKK